MSDIDIIANELNENSKSSLKGKLILLKGVWGSGKTYRWNNQIKPALNRKRKIYISLFGMQNIDEVKHKLYLEGIDCKFSNIWFKIFLLILFLLIVLAIFFYGVKLIYVDHLAEMREELQSFYIILLILIISSILLFLPVAKSIILYFINVMLGLNYHNVSLVKLLPPEETVICFDDFERITKNSQPDAFLGYFNTLARTYGYHILFIAHLSKESSNIQTGVSHKNSNLKLLYEYQEKLFDKIFEHEQSITEILEQKNINETLKECLFELIDKLKNKTSDNYDEETFPYIEKVRGNIRFVLKIIDNMETVYHYISADILNSNKIHCDVIKFVCGLTLAIETGYCSDMDDIHDKGLHHVFFEKPSSKKTFATFLMPYLSNIYGSLYDLIYKGFMTKQFEEEMFPQVKLTSFEKMVSDFSSKYYLEYRLEEIEKIYTKTQNILMKSDELFSSYTEMMRTLGKYCWLLSCAGKNLRKCKKIKIILFNNIRKILVKEKIPLIPFERISFSTVADNENFKISEQLIIVQIYKCLVENFIICLSGDKICDYFLDYSRNTNKYIQDIIYLILMSDDNFVNLQKLSETDYTMFMKIWRKLSEYSISWFEYKKICQAMHYSLMTYKKLLNKFEKIMKNLANGMPPTAPEMINYTQFLTDKTRKLREFTNDTKKTYSTSG